MKHTTRLLSLLVIISIWQAAVFSAEAAVPKKLLVVEITTGYRHGSIPTIEKMLKQLATQTGEFTIDVLAQPPGKPDNPKKDATPEQKAAYDVAEKAWEATLATALQKLSPDSLKNYDGVVFASTTGELPIPRQAGFPRLDQGRARFHRHSLGGGHVPQMARLHRHAGR